MKKYNAAVLTALMWITSSSLSVYLQKEHLYGGIEAFLCWLPSISMLGYTIRRFSKKHILSEYNRLINEFKENVESVYKEFDSDGTISQETKIDLAKHCANDCSKKLNDFMVDNPGFVKDDDPIIKFIKKLKYYEKGNIIPEMHYNAYLQSFDEFYKYLIW